MLAAVVAGTVVLGGAADAQTPPHRTESEACFAAAEAAQPLLKEHKLRAALRELSLCARDVCPRAARADCRTWLDEALKVEPSLVFRAREAHPGGDVAVVDVRVTIDGERITDRLDDTPVALDAGTHAVVFEHAGFPARRERIDVRQGEVRRIVEVVFGSTPSSSSVEFGPPSAPLPQDAPPTVVPPPSEGGAPAAFWGLLGGGAIATGLGITFEISGLAKRSHLVDTCRPTATCSQADVDAARTQVLTGDIVLGVGAALLVGAAYVYFSRSPDPAPPASSLRLRLGPAAGGFTAGLEGSL